MMAARLPFHSDQKPSCAMMFWKTFHPFFTVNFFIGLACGERAVVPGR
jgi:hypothetical protein